MTLFSSLLWILLQKCLEIQLNAVPESNKAFKVAAPTLMLYIDIWVSLMCIDSISVGLLDLAVAALRLVFSGPSLLWVEMGLG